MRGMIWTVAGLALLGLPAAVSATGTIVDDAAVEDPRWLPWIGCWESSPDAAQPAGEGEPGESLVCVSYLADTEGVQIETWVDGEVVAREELRTDGLSVPVQEGGCEGEQWTEWSGDGARLFLHSQMECGEGVTRATRGVLAIQDSGRRWMEIHAVAAGGSEPVLGVTSFRPASQEVVEQAGAQAAGQDRALAVSTARTMAARAMEPEAVAEAVREVGSEVTRALIVEAGQGFALDAATLRSLKADGVPEDVLDVMVAVSYPERFAVQGGTQDPEYRVQETTARDGRRAQRPIYGSPYGGYSPYGMGYRSAFYYGVSPYGYGYRNRYGYGGYGYGSAWGYPRGYWGAPVVIVEPPTVRQRGRMDRERGYVGPGDSGRRAVPRGSASAPSTTRRPTTMPAPSTRSAPEPAARPAAPRVTPPTRSTTSGGERRARPRRGGGGGGGDNGGR